MRNLLRHRVIGQRGLVVVALLLELHRTELKHGTDDAEDRVQVVLLHSHDVHALQGRRKLSQLVDTGNRHVALRQECVRLNVVQNVLLALLRSGTGQQLVEDMECALVLGLADRSGLLQQVGLDVGTGNVTAGIEVDANELAL